MNRYAAEGIIMRAFEDAQRFVIVNHNAHASREAFNELRSAASRMGVDSTATVQAANGQEQYSYQHGGNIRFITLSKGDTLRGVTADTIYIDGETTDAALTTTMMQDMHASIAASPHGEIIQA